MYRPPTGAHDPGKQYGPGGNSGPGSLWAVGHAPVRNNYAKHKAGVAVPISHQSKAAPTTKNGSQMAPGQPKRGRNGSVAIAKQPKRPDLALGA